MANNGLTRLFSAASLLVLALPSLADVVRVGPRPADPFLDPKNDPYNPLKYIASNTLTAIAISQPIIYLQSVSLTPQFLQV